MPLLDGYEATKVIRQMTKSLEQKPIIVACTGHTENSYVDRAFESGMNAVLMKPLESKKLSVILF